MSHLSSSIALICHLSIWFVQINTQGNSIDSGDDDDGCNGCTGSLINKL